MVKLGLPPTAPPLDLPDGQPRPGTAPVIPGIIVSYAQNFEDVLLWRALLDVPGGFYIDIGAQDPIVDSVSRGFYEQGWRGIHVEPSPRYADLLRKDRPDEIVVQAAVADERGLLTFFDVPDTGMSTVLPEVAEKASGTGRAVQRTTVTAVTLDDIFGLCKGTEVHWMKLDVEGYEHAALKGWRESEIRPWIVLLEAIAPHSNEPVHEIWEPVLLEKGYEFAYFDGLNRYYVSVAHPELKTRFGYGASFWDQFHLPEHSRLLGLISQRNRQQVVSLAEELQVATVARDELRQAHARIQDELAAVREEAARNRSESDRLRDALVTSHEACARFESSFAESEQALTKTRADLVLAYEELNRTRVKMPELQSSYDELNAGGRNSASKLDTLRAELEASNSAFARLQTEPRVIENAARSSSAQIESLNAELIALRAQYDDLHATAVQSAAELDQTKADFAALQGKYNAVQDTTSRLATELGQTTAELTLLRGKYSKLHDAAVQSSAELEGTQSELAALRSKYASLESVAARMSAELHEASAAFQRIQTQHASLQGTALRWSAELEKTTAELAACSAERDKVRAERDACALRLDAVLSAYNVLQDSTARLSAEFDSCRGKYYAPKDSTVAHISQLGESRLQLGTLRTEHRRLQETSSEVDAIRAEAAALRGGYDEVLDQAERLFAETTLLRRTLTQVHSAVQQVCSSAEQQPSFLQNALSAPQIDGDGPADSLEQLLGYYDRAFVVKAYATLLRRAPDPDGLAHFLQMLRAGRSRLAILDEIRLSEEGRVVNASLPGLDEALANEKRSRSFRARLSKRLRGQASLDPETEALVTRMAAQIPRFAKEHDAAIAHIGRLQTALRDIVVALEQPLDPNVSLPLRFIRTDGQSPDSAITEREIGRALLHIGAGANGNPITAVVGPPDAPLDPALRPALLLGHDWDESGYPQSWIDRLNADYVAVGCTSQHVRKILVDHGAEIPVSVVGTGVDHWDRIVPAALGELKARSFRFVHIARQPDLNGTDLALRSFARVFRSADDVSLVVACTSEAELQVRAQIDAIRSGDDGFPDVIVGVGRCEDADIKSLFGQASVLLAPARAAGFSRDIAFAISSGLDVIATRWGGHLDYCSDDNAWLVDFDFERAASPRSLMVSVWSRAKDRSLDDAVRAAHNSSPEARAARVQTGRDRLSRSFSWHTVASRAMRLSREAENRPALTKRRTGWITTWNIRCGIAGASGHLIDTLPQDDVVVFAALPKSEEPLRPDAENCRRLWQARKEDNGLSKIADELDHWDIGALMIQFNYGFYNHAELRDFIERVTERGVVVMIELHSTDDPVPADPNWRLDTLLPALKKCHRILTHNAADMNRLKTLGLVDNVLVFPLGVIDRGYTSEVRTLANRTPLLASFGFAFPNKGLAELVEAVSILRDQGQPVRLRMLNARHTIPASSEELERIQTMIARLGLENEIELRTEFLDEDVCLRMLHEADLIVNPYQKTGEAASAAVRFSLASKRPVAVTPISIFDELGGAVFRLPGISPSDIAQGISDCLALIRDDSPDYQALRQAADQWLDAHDFGRQARTLMKMARTLRYDVAATSGMRTN